jgi:signal transduction histidine kinase
MNSELEKVFGLSRDAAICISDGRISLANVAAVKLFECNILGQRAADIIPEAILSEKAKEFVTSAMICGKPCQVSALHIGRDLMLVLACESGKAASAGSGIVTGTLLNSMLSSLFNIGLSIDLMSERTELGASADKKTQQYLSILYHNYYSLKRLICNLNTAYALKKHIFQIFPRYTDVAELCADLVSTSSMMLGKKVEIAFYSELTRVMANVDPDGVERLLLNLIVNSYAHTEEGGRIAMRMQVYDGRAAIISVDDTGCGIPPERLRTVFSCYEVADETVLNEVGGSSGGLGLGIARGIAEAHGGSLIIESRQGIGTSVRVMLPLNLPGNGSFSAYQEEPQHTGMDNILTELSGQLDSRCYSELFRD